MDGQAINPDLGIYAWSGSLFMVFLLCLAIVGMVSITRSGNYAPATKFLWILLVVFAPILGVLLWFTIGKPRSKAHATQSS